MTFGRTQEQFNLLNQIVIAPLKDNGAQVFIFGSRTTDKHHHHSDVDILYKTPKADLPTGLIQKIKESIEESHFPYTVDLVCDTDLATSYRSSVYAQMKAV